MKELVLEKRELGEFLNANWKYSDIRELKHNSFCKIIEKMEGKCGETVRIKGGEDRCRCWWCWLAWILKEFHSETSIFSVK